jgi:hypothetical protein
MVMVRSCRTPIADVASEARWPPDGAFASETATSTGRTVPPLS